MSSVKSAYPIAEIVFSEARRHPQRMAIVSPEFQATYSDLARFVATFARRLQLRGVNQRSFLAFSLVDDVSILCAALASSIIGCRWIVMAPELIKDENTISPTHVLHDNFRHNIDQGNIICVGPWQFNADIEPHQLPAFGFQGYRNPNEIWRVSRSSGSTGKPKFIGITESVALGRVKIADDTGLPENPCIAVLFKTDVSVGLNMLMRAFHWRGTVMLYPNEEYLERYRPDMVYGSPAQIAKLLESVPHNEKLKLPLAMSGGSPLAKPFVELAFRYFEKLINRYGSTELGYVASKLVAQSSPCPYAVGTPDQGVDVEIVDEHGNLLDSGIEGILRLRSSTMVHTYLYDADNISRDIFRDGWFYPGDNGFIDSHGELVITGRTRDTLNLGGFKISAQSIDSKLLLVEGVRDCLTFSEIKNSTIPVLSALIVTDRQSQPKRVVDNLLTQYVKNTPRAEVPKYIYFVDNIPRNDNGKPTRHKAGEAAAGVEPIELGNLLSKTV